MTCTHVEVAPTDENEKTLQVSVHVGSDSYAIWLRSSVPLFVERADALVPLALAAAMRTRTPLMIPGTVSPRLLHNTGQAQDILASFSGGKLGRTTIVAEPAMAGASHPTGVGALFSGGMDSMYSVLKHESDITHLVFIRGFDIFEIESERGIASLESAREFARSIDKELIEIETNLRTLTVTFAPWHLAHGLFLASVALMLQSQLRRILIPSTYTYRDLHPWGSHPLLDPLWATESLEAVHDGNEASRPSKADLIATSDLALRHLRVCNKQWAGFNCGQCEKCVRTMIALHLARALDRCPTLPSPINPRQVARLDLDRHMKTFAKENLERARGRGDWPITLALLAALGPHPLRRTRRILGRVRRLPHASIQARRAARR